MLQDKTIVLTIMLGTIPHTKIQDKENQNDLFLLERDNQFVWESLGQIKLFKGEKEKLTRQMNKVYKLSLKN